jgi:hypothetical protein
VTLALAWNAPDEEAASFDHNGEVVIGRYASGWTETSATVTNPSGNVWVATVSGLSSFSDFAVGNAGALPVQLTSLTAAAIRGGATVCWSTATETNNYGFEIERRSVSVGQTFLSVRSDEWLKVGFVPGAGTSTSPRNYSYTDEGVAPGRYAYRIKQIDNGGAFQYYGAAEVEVGIVAKEFALDQNYPNPFNPTTSVSFSLAEPGRAVVKVYNVVGQEIAVLFDQEAEAGRLYQVAFDASQLTTGVYLYTLESGGQRMVRRMALVR